MTAGMTAAAHHGGQRATPATKRREIRVSGRGEPFISRAPSSLKLIDAS